MFDWFWHFLYQISKTLFKIIDGLVQCANYLCGVTPVKVDGEEVDFVEYILTSEQIGFAFRVAALLGMIVVVVFSVIAILRTLARENACANCRKGNQEHFILFLYSYDYDCRR